MALKKAVLGLVAHSSQAEAVVRQLHAGGFSNNEISVLFPNERDAAESTVDNSIKRTMAPEGALVGGAAGSIIGGTLGLLAGVGLLAIPGIGPFIVAGPILAALSGIATGAAVGGLTGALIGMGVPEVEATRYVGELKTGSVLLAVHVENSEERAKAKDILETAGARNVVLIGDESPAPNKATSASPAP